MQHSTGVQNAKLRITFALTILMNLSVAVKIGL